MVTLASHELDTLVRADAIAVLHKAWQPRLGYCQPNRHSYPHLWLWDSCFHSIAWSALRDDRAIRELDALFEGQLPGGFLPHMRYGRRTYPRGPLPKTSSFTQPPVYVHALQVALNAGFAPSDALIDKAASALGALWRDRLRKGLLVIVHPWEAGTDDSPRWDGWVGSTVWRRRRWTDVDRKLLASVVFSGDGVAIDNPDFVVAPASFNAIAANAARTLGDLLGDKSWRVRGAELADALDHAAWDGREKLWRDVAFAGPPMSEATLRVPTLDAALPALCTADRTKAENAIAQFSRPDRFFAPYGLRFLPPNHPSYNPAQYWRGPAWPQLNYLAALAARHCGLPALANDIAQTTKRAVLRARFSEYWNPETGRGLGARPQTWAAVVAAM